MSNTASNTNCPLGDFLNNPHIKDYIQREPKTFNDDVPVNRGSAILSDREIKAEMEKGNIFISPVNEKQLGNCSYDITLGENYYYRRPRSYRGVIFNPFVASEVHNFWSSPVTAATVTKWQIETDSLNTHGLKVGDKYINLDAHETILCHSNEFIGGRKNITTMLKARSSLGRMGISITTGGWGDIGFTSRWVMAITNNTDCAMILPVGQRIAQIVFMWTGECDKSYEQRGQYQKSSDMQEVMAKWTPEDMLPKV